MGVERPSSAKGALEKESANREIEAYPSLIYNPETVTGTSR